MHTTFYTGFKMALMILLAMLTVCAAVPRDLSDKVFTFPQQTNTAHVRLTTSRQELRAATVCLRSFTDLRRDHSLFSLATPSAANEIVIFKTATSDVVDLYIRDAMVQFVGQNYNVNTWHSICSTWDSSSGVAQLWIDGKPSSRRFVSSGSNIRGPIIIVLGQEQDNHGGGFDINQSFIGMISDVHVWDHTLSVSEIQKYTDDHKFTPGNVLNWMSLEFQTAGRVLIEDKQTICN